MIALAIGALFIFVPEARPADSYQRGVAVGYWTHTWLTGCVAPGRCVMACGGYLDDSRFTVASNPKWHLGCGQRLRICYRRCVDAIVKDRTASIFDFEFTYALSLATGQPRSNWAGPRTVRWRRIYRATEPVGPPRWIQVRP